MPNLKKFAELDTAHRGDPCAEYPGTYYVYTNGGDERGYHERFDAISDARGRYELAGPEDEITVCWACSPKDPRIGQLWFTGFCRVS